MSLEQSLERNTAAIERLISVLSSPVELTDTVGNKIVSTIHHGTPAAAEPLDTTETAKPKRASKKEAAPATVGESLPEADAQSREPGVAGTPETEDAATATEPLTYAAVQAATLAAVKAGRRTVVVAILDGYGVKRVDHLREEIWPEYLARLFALSNDEVPF